MLTRPLPPVVFWLGLAFAAALPASHTLDPRLDPDTWWHMATGRWIAENKTVPWTDPFSHMSLQSPARWYAYSWFFELGMYEIYKDHGFAGVFLIGRLGLTAFSTATLFAFLVSRGGCTLLTLLQAMLLAAVLMMFARERPWHFTIAFTTLTVWAVESLRGGGSPRRVLWLPAVYLVWANVHIQFVNGWLVLGLAVLFPGSARRRDMLIVAAPCVLACIVNPYHVRLLEVILEYATQAAPREFVDELAPPELASPATLATLLLVLVGTVLGVRRMPRDGFAFVLGAVAVLMAARMRRELWFAALAGIVLVPARALGPASHPLRSRGAAGTLAAVLTAFGLVITVKEASQSFLQTVRTINDDTIDYTFKDDLELQAIRAQRGPSFRIDDAWSPSHPRWLNHFDDGGRLIWSRHSVAIDGRTNLYGDDRIRNSFQLWNCEGDWRNHRDLKHARIILAPRGLPLTAWLLTSPKWGPSHLLNDHIVFYRCE